MKTQPPWGYISHGKAGLAWESAFFKVPKTGGGLLQEVDLAVWCVSVEVLGFPRTSALTLAMAGKEARAVSAPSQQEPGVISPSSLNAASVR